MPKLPVRNSLRVCQLPKQGTGCERDICHARVLPPRYRELSLREQACPCFCLVHDSGSHSQLEGRSWGPGCVLAKVLLGVFIILY